MAEWLDSEEEKGDLLKFIEEMKIMSSKKSSRTNPLLIKPTNSSEKKNAYDDFLMLDELLSAEILKNSTKQENSNQTNKIITGNTQQSHTHDWSTSERSESINKEVYEEQITKPAEKESKSKIFDPQNLIERIRKLSNATHVTSNYELLSCKSQTFLQRLAVLGEILT